MRLRLSLPSTLRSTVGTSSGRGGCVVLDSRLVRGFLRHHEAYLDRTAGDFREDCANQVDETSFQMRFSKCCRHAHYKYAILEGECSGALKPGCENGGLNFCLQPFDGCLPNLFSVHTHSPLGGHYVSDKHGCAFFLMGRSVTRMAKVTEQTVALLDSRG